MKNEHRWANSWPGNYCLDCGMGDPIEEAIICAYCYIPGPEDENQEMKLCYYHNMLASKECSKKKNE